MCPLPWQRQMPKLRLEVHAAVPHRLLLVGEAHERGRQHLAGGALDGRPHGAPQLAQQQQRLQRQVLVAVRHPVLQATTLSDVSVRAIASNLSDHTSRARPGSRPSWNYLTLHLVQTSHTKQCAGKVAMRFSAEQAP